MLSASLGNLTFSMLSLLLVLPSLCSKDSPESGNQHIDHIFLEHTSMVPSTSATIVRPAMDLKTVPQVDTAPLKEGSFIFLNPKLTSCTAPFVKYLTTGLVNPLRGKGTPGPITWANEIICH